MSLQPGVRWPRSRFGAIPIGPEGPAGTGGGDLTGIYPNPELKDISTPGTGTKPTVDAKGRVTGFNPLIAGDLPAHTHAKSDITGLVADLAEIEEDLGELSAAMPTTQFLPLANGDPDDPQLIFDDDGDIVVSEVPLP